MPCQDTLNMGDMPNGYEKHLNQIAFFLEEILLNKPLPDNFKRGEHKDVYGKKVDADYMTSKLCKLCARVDVTVYSSELQAWWKEHNVVDEARVAKEAAIEREVLEDIAEMKQQALSKLSTTERSLLGLS
jgi:hypothetical protein